MGEGVEIDADAGGSGVGMVDHAALWRVSWGFAAESAGLPEVFSVADGEGGIGERQ